jgi:hypothetical protein
MCDADLWNAIHCSSMSVFALPLSGTTMSQKHGPLSGSQKIGSSLFSPSMQIPRRDVLAVLQSEKEPGEARVGLVVSRIHHILTNGDLAPKQFPKSDEEVSPSFS